MMVKAWMADDLQIWVAQRATLFPEYSKNLYYLGSASGANHACQGTVEGVDYFQTTLSAASAANDTTLTVTSITGFATTQTIGVVLDDGTMHWTTINGAPSGTTITLTAGVASAAASGNNVYAYTAANTIQRPLKLLEIWRHSVSSDVDIPIRLISRAEYDERPYKLYSSLAVEAFYNPVINNGPINSNGELQIWPEFSDLNTLIQFRYLRPLQDLDTTSDDFDFPQEWYEALTINLAYRLSWNYGMPLQDRYLLKKDAAEAKNAALAWSQENASVFLEPDYAAEQGF